MRGRTARVLMAALGCLFSLSACETQIKLGDLFQSKPELAQSRPQEGDADPSSTAALPPPPPAPSPGSDAAPNGLSGNDPDDDLSLGKKYFRAADFSLAEQHFRQAVEHHPRDLEAWIGLAAAYDRLRRWSRADRAYQRAMKISGPQPELLNNWGYSYMLRGDYRRARETLLQAQAQDPSNPYVKNNLDLLEASLRKGKAVQ